MANEIIGLTNKTTGVGIANADARYALAGLATASGLNSSATDKLLGRSTASSGAIEEITCTAAGRALLDDADAAAQRVTLGILPTVPDLSFTNTDLSSSVLTVTGVTPIVSIVDNNGKVVIPYEITYSTNTLVDLTGHTPITGTWKVKFVQSGIQYPTITTDTTVYVATTGSDTTGTGLVGAPFASLSKALTYLNSYVIAGNVTVTIQIADGTYNSQPPITINHSNSNNIKIVGNNTTPANVVLNFSTSGFSVFENKVLNISGVRISGPGYAAGTTGILCERNGLVMNSTGEKLTIDTWNIGIKCNSATAYLFSLDVSYCMYSLFCNIGSRMLIIDCAIAGNVTGCTGVFVTNSSSIIIVGTVSITNSTTGICAQINSTADITGATYSGNGTNTSPAVNTLGNANSYIYRGS